MEWYYIVLIGILSLLLIILLTSYICYKMTFYSNNNPYKRTDEIIIPKGSLYEDFKDVIVKDVMYARSFNPKEYEIISFDNLTLKAKYYEYKKGAPIEIMLHGYDHSYCIEYQGEAKFLSKKLKNHIETDERGKWLWK